MFYVFAVLPELKMQIAHVLYFHITVFYLIVQSAFGLSFSRLDMLFPTQYDVGVDNNDFTPVSFAQVKRIIQKQIEQ